VTLTDTNGTEYLDFGASYACTPVGHCHPEVVDAATSQIEELMYVQASYPRGADGAVRAAFRGRAGRRRQRLAL